MKYEEKQVQVSGNLVSFIDEGQVGTVTIIFIHGFPFNKWTWENQIDAFKAGYRVIAYDIRGHGNSVAVTSPVSIDQFANDLFLFMDALGVEKTIICGLSMGGYIALNAIGKHPDRIEALILCDTQCSGDSAEGKKKRMDVIASVQERGLEQYAHDSVQKLFCETSLNRMPNEVLLIEQTILRTPIDTIVNTLKALAERMDTCSELHQISIPVLIIVGESDQITPPKVGQKMKDLITGSVFQVIEKAGHLSNLENPISFNGHVQRFLTAIEQVTKRL